MGGTTENRVRLLVEIIQEVRKAVGEDFTTGIRIPQSKVNDYPYKWSGIDSLVALAKVNSQLPIIANGQLAKPERASGIINNGHADIVTLGKGALANHDWVKKVQNEEPLEEFDSEKVLRPTAVIKDFEL
ncbi:tRNA-dihydrouridine synthase [Peribacillus simplex]|uniref:oxidoreductase n=1 Tax=Peribacillus simplex TaxID=1478 RepID=UPI003D7038EF